MNEHGMLHIADSAYCFPVSEKELVLRLRTAKGDIKKASVIYESKYVFGEKQKTQDMEKAYSDRIYDYFVVRLKTEDTRLAYVFYVNDGKRNYFFSENGITDSYNFQLGYYNFFQYPYINKADIMDKIEWVGKANFYQIFVDRFNIGNKSKDMSYINCSWGDIPTPKTFAGGDLKGITDKLDYIKELGCNVIYLTPVFESVSNHKYDIIDYYKIDKQFGTNEDLKELVDKAHDRDMKVVLDAVFNHCSENTEQFKDVLAKGKASEYFDWFVIYGDEVNENRDNYEIFGPCKYMPKWNTSNEAASEFLIDIGRHYINEYDIDGWRLDVSDEVSHTFWRKFRSAIKHCKKDALLLGENWHDAYSNLRGDQFDGIMNYSFTKACLDYFAFNVFEAEDLTYRLSEILMRNTDTVNYMMLNLLDSHDTHRFYSEVSEDDFSLEAALCLTYMFPGAPCIYYGTEIRMQGGYDPDCRRCMDWDKTDDKMRELLKKLAELRTVYGIAEGTVEISSEKDDFILIRKTNDHEFELRINKKKKNYEILMDGGIYL